jgi:hypothetical protein
MKLIEETRMTCQCCNPDVALLATQQLIPPADTVHQEPPSQHQLDLTVASLPPQLPFRPFFRFSCATQSLCGSC